MVVCAVINALMSVDSAVIFLRRPPSPVNNLGGAAESSATDVPPPPRHPQPHPQCCPPCLTWRDLVGDAKTLLLCIADKPRRVGGNAHRVLNSMLYVPLQKVF